MILFGIELATDFNKFTKKAATVVTKIVSILLALCMLASLLFVFISFHSSHFPFGFVEQMLRCSLLDCSCSVVLLPNIQHWKFTLSFDGCFTFGDVV